SGFTYIGPPTVSSVAPNNGSTAGGTPVTITGTLQTVSAAAINAASCSQTDVQAALNAAGPGYTVLIPAGTGAWTTQVAWAAPPNVILQGAGNASVGGGDQTVIIDNYASNNPLLKIVTNAIGAFRLTGITLRGGSGSIKYTGMVSIGGSSHQF